MKQEESREVWIVRWINDLIQDTAFAVRMISKQPGFTAVAALSAALGIGACSAIFAIANHAMFRSLPVDDPSRLVSISGRNLRSGKLGVSITYPDFQDLARAHSLQGVAAFFQSLPATISSGGEPQRYWVLS